MVQVILLVQVIQLVQVILLVQLVRLEVVDKCVPHIHHIILVNILDTRPCKLPTDGDPLLNDRAIELYTRAFVLYLFIL
jgi:hypothetical protein